IRSASSRSSRAPSPAATTLSGRVSSRRRNASSPGGREAPPPSAAHMAPPPLQVEHRCRVSLLEKEILWHLGGDTLFKIAEGQPPFSIPLASLAEVRLQFAPTRYQKGRFIC